MRCMRPRFLAIVLVALSACVAPPPRALHSRAGHLLAWCSGTLRDAAGTPAWTPPGSYLVEILPDGTVRDVHNSAVSGRPGPRALHLFASTDVSLHMGAIDGPVIATASPGVAFSLVSYGEEVCEVAFGTSDNDELSPRVFVRTADLALEVKKNPLPELPPSPTLRGMAGSLHVTPGGAQIGNTSCFGPVRLLEEELEPLSRQRWLHVQIINQVPYDRKAPRLVIDGWMKRDELRPAPECGSAIVLSHPDIPDERARALVPPGFIERARPAAMPLADGGSVHWLTGQGDCVEARRLGEKLTPLGAARRPALRRRIWLRAQPGARPDHAVRPEFNEDRRPRAGPGGGGRRLCLRQSIHDRRGERRRPRRPP
jgi:hypothetical protein